MSRQYTWQELNKMPTLCKSQCDELKIEEPGYRVWLCPTSNRIEIEQWISQKWEITQSWYPYEDEENDTRTEEDNSEEEEDNSEEEDDAA